MLLPAVLRFNEPAAPEKYRRLRRAIELPAGAELSAWIAETNARPATRADYEGMLREALGG